jgi:hypothetical protein
MYWRKIHELCFDFAIFYTEFVYYVMHNSLLFFMSRYSSQTRTTTAHCGKKHWKINIVLWTREAAKKINEKRIGRSGIKLIKIQSRSSEKIEVENRRESAAGWKDTRREAEPQGKRGRGRELYMSKKKGREKITKDYTKKDGETAVESMNEKD